jgi:hypothetical protein
VRSADVQLGGEQASNAAVQIIGDPAYPKIPSACTNGGFPSNDTQATLGANGLIGVGNLVQDCGLACAIGGVSNPGLYYECSSPTNCQVAAVGTTQQVQNPVALFAADNNGVLIQLPSVAVSAPQLNGSLIFGIGTQANNGLGTATPFTFNQDGFLGTNFNGQNLPFSFIDSGSNFLSFPDSKIPTCKDFQNAFYCPPKSLNLSATIQGLNSSAAPVPFTVDNADTVSNAHPTDSVFATIGATTVLPQGNGQNGPKSFDWGLPFYYGRNVYTAIEGRSTPNGNGPYVAF